MQAGGGRRGRSGLPCVDRLVALGRVERLRDVRGQRRLARRLAVEPQPPASLAEVLEQLDRPIAATGAQPSCRPGEPFPDVAFEPLQQQHLAARCLDRDPRRDDARVVDDDEFSRQLVRQI